MGGVVDVESPRENEEHAAFRKASDPVPGRKGAVEGRISSDGHVNGEVGTQLPRGVQSTDDVNHEGRIEARKGFPRSDNDTHETAGIQSTPARNQVSTDSSSAVSRNGNVDQTATMHEMLRTEREARESTERRMQEQYSRDQQEREKKEREVLSLLQDGLEQERKDRDNACNVFKNALDSDRAARHDFQEGCTRRLELVEKTADLEQAARREYQEGWIRRLELLEQSFDSEQSARQQQFAQNGSLEDLASQLRLLEQRQSQMQGQLADLESKGSQGASQMHLDALESRLVNESLAKHEQLLKALQATDAKMNEVQDNHAAQASGNQERLNILERSVADSTDKHKQHLEAIASTHAKMDGVHGSVQQRLDSLMQTSIELSGKQQRSMDRFESMEKEFHESAQRSLQAVQTVNSTRDGQISGLQERLASVEAALQENRSASSSVENESGSFQGRLASLEAAHQSLQSLQTANIENQLASLKAQSDSTEANLEAARTARASQENQLALLQERLSSLEKTVQDDREKHLAGLKSHSERLDSLQAHSSGTEAAGSGGETSVVNDGRLDSMEKLILDCTKKQEQHAQSLEYLHGRAGADAEARQQHASMTQDRLETLEKHMRVSTPGESAVMQAAQGSQLAEGRARLDQIAESTNKHEQQIVSVQQRCDSLEQRSVDFQDKLRAECEARQEQHYAIQGRVDCLDKQIGESATLHEKHLKAIEAADLKIGAVGGNVAAHGRTADIHQIEVNARLEDLEKRLREPAHKTPTRNGSASPPSTSERLSADLFAAFGKREKSSGGGRCCGP